MNLRRWSGFTLIELMIVVVVISILVAVAYPSYQDHVRKSKRTEGKSALLRAAQVQERFFTDQNRYATQAELATAMGAASPTIYSGENPSTAAGASYTITVTPAAPTTTFTLTATPAAPFVDTDCTTFTIDERSVKNWGTAPAKPEKCRW